MAGKGWSPCTNVHLLTSADMVAAAELQHEEDVKAAEGQHEKMKHAKASASKPEPEAQGEEEEEREAVATKVFNGGKEPNPDSTPAPPQSPQVPLLLVFILFILACLSSLVAVLFKQDRGPPGGVYMPDPGERHLSDECVYEWEG